MMKVLDPGHSYKLNWLDGTAPQSFHDEWAIPADVLTFVKREGEKYPGNNGHHPGTNIQEVCRALIDRLKYIDNQIHDDRNTMAIIKLQHVIWLLEDRAAERHHRGFDISFENIETFPTCTKCGHIGCERYCR